jgi:1-acyl-sn-glycerol-3-phosphate acyltransferase
MLLAQGFWIVTRQFPHLDDASRQRAVQAWAQRVLSVFSLSVDVTGSIGVRGPLFLVSNHLSWLDILVYLSLTPVRFVSKSEVADWPLVGRYAKACRTLFIERNSRRDAGRMVEQLVESLKGGDVVMIFPEGTTSTGEVVLPFHANLLKAPLESACPVQAVGLVYRLSQSGAITTVPTFVGDQTLVASIWAILGLEPFRANIQCGLPHTPQTLNRRELAKALQGEVTSLKAKASV